MTIKIYICNFKWVNYWMTKNVHYVNLNSCTYQLCDMQQEITEYPKDATWLHQWINTTHLITTNISKSQETLHSYLYHRQQQFWVWLLKISRGPFSIYKCYVTYTGNDIVKIGWPQDHLMSTMGFTIIIRWHLYVEKVPTVNWTVVKIWSDSGMLAVKFNYKYSHLDPGMKINLIANNVNIV